MGTVVSQACGSTRHINRRDLWQIEESQTSEEMEDSDESIDDFQMVRTRRGSSMPIDIRQIHDNLAKKRRAISTDVTRSTECPMNKETKEWHRSLVVNREGELQAKRYCKMVTDDTWKQLRHTIRTAGSVADKGTAINNELARQERVLSTAENDITIAEYDAVQTTEKLKGMKSYKGKLASMVLEKDQKFRKNKCGKEAKCNLWNEDAGLGTFSKTRSREASSVSKDISADTEAIEVQLKAGIMQLSKTLDTITVQQMNTALALDQQDGRLSVFDNQMSTTHQKINCQTQMIKSMLGK